MKNDNIKHMSYITAEYNKIVCQSCVITPDKLEYQLIKFGQPIEDERYDDLMFLDIDSTLTRSGHDECFVYSIC